MMTNPIHAHTQGPFRADQLRDGDCYELSHGHPIYCAPSGRDHAGPGQDEQELQEKIAELLAKGTQQIWVVRLVGPRRVEVHQPRHKMQILGPGEQLHAPGILRQHAPSHLIWHKRV